MPLYTNNATTSRTSNAANAVASSAVRRTRSPPTTPVDNKRLRRLTETQNSVSPTTTDVPLPAVTPPPAGGTTPRRSRTQAPPCRYDFPAQVRSDDDDVVVMPDRSSPTPSRSTNPIVMRADQDRPPRRESHGVERFTGVELADQFGGGGTGRPLGPFILVARIDTLIKRRLYVKGVSRYIVECVLVSLDGTPFLTAAWGAEYFGAEEEDATMGRELAGIHVGDVVRLFVTPGNAAVQSPNAFTGNAVFRITIRQPGVIKPYTGRIPEGYGAPHTWGDGVNHLVEDEDEDFVPDCDLVRA